MYLALTEMNDVAQVYAHHPELNSNDLSICFIDVYDDYDHYLEFYENGNLRQGLSGPHYAGISVHGETADEATQKAQHIIRLVNEEAKRNIEAESLNQLLS